MRAQGAAEYIIMLGVLLLIVLIVAVSIQSMNLLNFSKTTQIRVNNIMNTISDVGVQTKITETGLVEASAMTMRYRLVTDFILEISNEQNQSCSLNTSEVSGTWTSMTNNCTFLSGNPKESYSFKCTMRYTDPDVMINYSKAGVCTGVYETN